LYLNNKYASTDPYRRSQLNQHLSEPRGVIFICAGTYARDLGPPSTHRDTPADLKLRQHSVFGHIAMPE